MCTAAESHLRLLAEQDLARRGRRPEFDQARASLGAVAKAFMMLGLLSSAQADNVLREVGETFETRSPLDARPGARPEADDYWRLRSRGPYGLSWLPQAVAAGPLRLTTGSARLSVEWLRLSQAGLRFQVEATVADADSAARHVGLALADLVLTDDLGTAYQMEWDAGSGTGAFWMGEVLALPPPPEEVSLFAFRAAGSATRQRMVVPAPLPVEVGTADPPWPTPAESYLALLGASDPPPKVGRNRASDVVAAVAEALLQVGAIPSDSPLVAQALSRQKRSWHPILPLTWPNPVRRGTAPDRQIAICAGLPFASAAVVIEGLSGWGQDIQLHLYGWPWTHSEPWPAAIPSFTVRAIDNLGVEHEGRLGIGRSYDAGEAHGDFTLWPAVRAEVNRLRVVVTTLWESAWADIELPPAPKWSD